MIRNLAREPLCWGCHPTSSVAGRAVIRAARSAQSTNGIHAHRGVRQRAVMPRVGSSSSARVCSAMHSSHGNDGARLSVGSVLALRRGHAEPNTRPVRSIRRALPVGRTPAGTITRACPAGVLGSPSPTTSQVTEVVRVQSPCGGAPTSSQGRRLADTTFGRRRPRGRQGTDLRRRGGVVSGHGLRPPGVVRGAT